MNTGGYKITTIISYERTGSVWVCKVTLSQSRKIGDTWDERSVEDVEISKTESGIEDAIALAMKTVTDYLSSVGGDLFNVKEESNEALDS